MSRTVKPKQPNFEIFFVRQKIGKFLFWGHSLWDEMTTSGPVLSRVIAHGSWLMAHG
jgi:hypothetical protein